ncbi:multidrug efflux SMR transporter [Telmatospirillum sp. J64-1]|uniref:DMT family transporter n=1 Tax=Telmatospirillum sp. J64-1 TaxID=2502183 RepID=UPI00115D1F2A|nr:multidrug efflux SMR transporter [Telmatospirillum sp. J64-1]
MPYLLLIAAIIAEVTATTALKASAGFSKLGPSLLVVSGYGIAFWLLSLTLERLPLAAVYAIWSGVGMAGVAMTGWLLFRESLGPVTLAGIGIIVLGVAVLAWGMQTGR